MLMFSFGLYIMCHGCGQLYGSAAGFPVIPEGPEFRVRTWGLQDPNYLSTESYFIWAARLTTPTRLGSLFRLTFPVTSQRNGNYDSNTKHKGHRYGSHDLSRCQLHRDSNAINSIITQKQLYLTMKTVRTSGTVPGEHTVGQTRLTVQLAVGSQRTASQSGRDLL